MRGSMFPLTVSAVLLLAGLGAVVYLGATRVLSADAVLGLVASIIASAAGIGGASAGVNGTAKVGEAMTAHLDRDHVNHREG